eukprot:scaffold48431_cov64-Phaeocystis_antarctica.AAC.1
MEHECANNAALAENSDVQGLIRLVHVLSHALSTDAALPLSVCLRPAHAHLSAYAHAHDLRRLHLKELSVDPERGAGQPH